MAFPAAPANGQVYSGALSGVVYVYDSGKGVWNIRPTNVFKRQATTGPTSPIYGDVWFDTASHNTYIWTNDGTSDYWLDISGGGGSSASTMTAATPLAAGTSGLTPTNAAGTNYKFLRGDGTWAGPTFVSASAPTANDDSGDGFFVGAMWYDSTTGYLYSAQSVGVGAAVWSRVGSPTLSTYSGGQYGVGSIVLGRVLHYNLPTAQFLSFVFLDTLSPGATFSITATANKFSVSGANFEPGGSGGFSGQHVVSYGTWIYLGSNFSNGNTVNEVWLFQRIA